jgi:small subunit ribosomal protein S5
MENTGNNKQQQKPGSANPQTQVRRNDSRGGRPMRSKFDQKDRQSEFDKKIISIRRVSKTYSGGKRMRLSVFLVVGDRKGRVGLGLGKGSDVVSAEEKAVSQAKTSMVLIKLKGNTIAHELLFKKGAAKVFLKPASPGTGVIASGPLRAVLEAAGVKDILTKVIGCSNPITNAYAVFAALQNLKG